MEVGGRGSLASFRRPLAGGSSNIDLDLETGRPASEGPRLEARDKDRDGSSQSSHDRRAASPRRGSPATSPTASAPLAPPISWKMQLPPAETKIVARGDTSSLGRIRSLPQTAGEAAVYAAAAASVAGAGRRLQSGAIALRRAATPIRAAAEARKALKRSLRAEGECYAICMAGGLDLAGLAEASIAHTEAGRATAAASAAAFKEGWAASSSSLSKGVSGGFGHTTESDKSSGNNTSPSNSSENLEARLAGLGGAQLVKHFGTGENIVLQLKLWKGKDIFAFGFGCIVCWGFDSNELKKTTEKMRPFLIRPLPQSDVEEESMEFVVKRINEDDLEDVMEEDEDEDAEEAGAKVGIRQDQIILSTTSNLEKLAHSYALAQSVRLGSFELVVDRSIASTRSIPETMAETGEVNLEARDLSKQMGGLLCLRCDVNLHTDILDTPDIFWDEEKFEPHYVACRGYLDIDKRVEILNQRLGVLKDLYDLLQNSLNVKHTNKLEWIVIILILVEVMLECIQLAWTK